jgi:ketosteroid isomerase-like protein
VTGTTRDLEDAPAVVALATRMAWLADQRDWDALPGLFTDRVRVDYTSLNGGEPATLPAAELVAGWRAVLGGLDATQHLLGNHLVEIDGDHAVCTAQFQATHVLAEPAVNPHGGTTWTLGGHYRYQLDRAEGAWRIAGLTMTAAWATGNQQIMSLAAARAAGPAAPPRSAADAAQAFLHGLEAMDVDAALANFADDAVQQMPFAPDGFPGRLDGIAALRRQYGGLPHAYRSMRFPVSRAVDYGDVAVLEYRGMIELAGGGRYDNAYIGVFETREGQIVRFTEYFDPIVLRDAFGDTVAGTFGLDAPGQEDD